MSQTTDSAESEAPAIAEKPVDPALLALALKREQQRVALRTATDRFHAALMTWRTKAAVIQDLPAAEGGSDDTNAGVRMEETTAAEAVEAAAVDWMVANGVADLSDVPTTFRGNFGLFSRRRSETVATAREKALAILLPITQRRLPHGVPEIEIASVPATNGVYELPRIDDKKEPVVGVDFFPEQIATNSTNPPIHSAEELRVRSAFFQ